MFTLKDGQEFDYSLLFNAVAAQDAQSVVRALRPFLSLHEFSEIEGDADILDFDIPIDEVERGLEASREKTEGAIQVHQDNFEEILSRTLAALSDDIRGEVAAYLYYNNISVSQDFQEELGLMSFPKERQTQLVAQLDFHKALQAVVHADDSNRSRRESNLLTAAGKVYPGHKYDAYMTAAYAIQDPNKKERALGFAYEERDSIPVRGAFTLDDIRYHALLEIYGVSAEYGEIDLKMPRIIDTAQRLRSNTEPMDRQTYLARLTPAS